MDEEKAYYRNLLLSKPEALEDFPFYPDVAVYKVRKKMFATLSQTKGIWEMNLKCDPNQAMLLREIYSGVRPGYHMNKKHWNTVILDGTVPDSEVRFMIDHSYALVVRGMKKSDREFLQLRYTQEELYGE